jgi:predicted RNA binding protein YcfA (HicA-like mRNA interferase family)
MSSRYPPLDHRDVVRILTNLGFSPLPRTGTSHEQWVRVSGGLRRKVTLDSAKAPFARDLVSSMARQAGVSKAEFYAALKK